MVRIDRKSFKPADDLKAMDEAFESLAESTGLSSPDDYIELRQEMMVRFDSHYRSLGRQFNIQEVFSTFANKVWHFARGVAVQRGVFSRESICTAFEGFCASGEIVLGPAGGVKARDLFSQVSRPQLEYMLWDVDRIGVDLYGAARILLDDASAIEGFAARFEKALSLSRDGDDERLAELSELIFGDKLLSHMGNLSDAFEDYFFGPFNERLRAHARSARIAYEHDRTEDADKAVKELSGTFSEIKGAFDGLSKVFITLKSKKLALKKILNEESAIEVLDRHRPFMRQFASVGHDYTNFLMEMEEYLSRLVGDNNKISDLAHLEDLCEKWSCETVSQLLGLVRLKRKAVSVSAEGMDSVPIPERMRRLLFRMVFELVRNADKYADKEKEEQIVDASASLNGSILEFVVEDNGVGIDDVEKVMRGERERPDLAKGDGIGLPGIVRLSEKNDLIFKLESEKGVGTRASLKVDMSGWTGSGGVLPFGARLFTGFTPCLA